ncbi:MAG: hypothetical protein ACRC67_22710 [Inquilinus sp.]|uniref:hypothetical protein n=1 Tax=Inquilinus sp. TaxID=1932117 RepID=UPI003F356100
MVDRHSPAEEKRRFVAAFEPTVAAASAGHAPVAFEVVDLGLQYHAPLDDLDPDLVLTFEEARYMPHAGLRNRFHDIVEEMQDRFWPGELPGDFPWEEKLWGGRRAEASSALSHSDGCIS